MTFRHALLREVIDADLLPGRAVAAARWLCPRPYPAARAGRWPARGRRPPSWPPTGTRPASPPGPCRPGSRPGWPPTVPMPSPRPNATTSAPWSCGTRCLQPESLAGTDRLELLTSAADAARFSGRIQRALVLLTDALDQLDPATDPVRVALLLMRLGHARWGTGDEPACLAALEEAVRILPATPSAERARVLAAQAQWLMPADRVRRGRAPRHRGAGGRPHGWGPGRGGPRPGRVLGTCTADIGHLEQALGIAEEAGNAEGIVLAYDHLGTTLSLRRPHPGGRSRNTAGIGGRPRARAGAGNREPTGRQPCRGAR